MPQPLMVWIKTKCGKFLMRWKYQTTLPTTLEIWIPIKKKQYWRWNSGLVPNGERNMSRLPTVTLLTWLICRIQHAGDLGSVPGLGRSPAEGKGYPHQYSGLKNSMDCIVHRITKSWSELSDFHFHFASCEIRAWRSTNWNQDCRENYH